MNTKAAMILGGLVVIVLLLALVYYSSAGVRKLREEGQFGTTVETA